MQTFQIKTEALFASGFSPTLAVEEQPIPASDVLESKTVLQGGSTVIVRNFKRRPLPSHLILLAFFVCPAQRSDGEIFVKLWPMQTER